MEHLTLGSLSIALFLSALLWGKAGRTTADGLLAAWFGLMAVHLGAVLVIARQQVPEFQGLLHLSQALTLLTGALLWLYAQALTHPGFRLRPYARHLLPAGVALALLPAALAAPPAGWVGPVYRALTAGGGLLSVLLYCLGILRTLRQHRQVARQLFSDPAQVRLRWLRNAARYLLGLLAVFGLSQAVFALTPWQLDQFGNWYANWLLGSTLVLIGYFGVQQHALYSPGAEVTPAEIALVLHQCAAFPAQEAPQLPHPAAGPGPKYQRSGLPTAALDGLWAQLQHHMLTQRPYLDAALSLPALSRQLGARPHHVSQAINERGGQNFFDFVNGYRVAAVQQQLQAHAHQQLTLLGVALDCGFNSKASFNRAFKKVAHCTPRAYLAQVAPALSPALVAEAGT